LHHVGDGADRVFDRHGRVDACGLIKIDMVGAEAAQRIGDKMLDRDRPDVVAEYFFVGAALPGELLVRQLAGALHLPVIRSADCSRIECNIRYSKQPMIDGSDIQDDE
jgi:hypothetical protein